MKPAEDSLSPVLEAAFHRFAGGLRVTAAGFGLAGDDLDELEQEIRLRLWKASQSGETIGAVSASYFRQVARTAAIDLFRRRRARREDSLPEGVDRSPGTPPVAEEKLAMDEFTAALSRALNGLVVSRQSVVRMYLAGYSREEISELMGWSEGKVRNLLYRGLEDLRERLTAMGVTEEDVR